MIDVSSVTELFLMYASAENADETIQSLCQSSAYRIEQSVKPDTDMTDDRLIVAAASDAFYQWLLITKAESADSFESFRAGDITVKGNGSLPIEAAKKLKDEAFRALLPLLCDNGFYFGEVLINDVEPTF